MAISGLQRGRHSGFDAVRQRIKMSGVRKFFTSTIPGILIGFAFALLRSIPLSISSSVFAFALRNAGPLLREDAIGRDNLRHAFPEMPADEVEKILTGVWDNLGRTIAEFGHLRKIWSIDFRRPESGTVEPSPGDEQRVAKLKADETGAVLFSAHLANWEVSALAALAFGLKSAVLYRGPSIKSVDLQLRKIRGEVMGELIPATVAAPGQILRALKENKLVGMLVDQHRYPGIEVEFFGRKALANPLLAEIVSRYPCPIYGIRAVRLPGGRFRTELTDEIAPVLTSSGEIDIPATTQKITSIIEGWIREYPDQWLWVHRRWR